MDIVPLYKIGRRKKTFNKLATVDGKMLSIKHLRKFSWVIVYRTTKVCMHYKCALQN